MSHVMGVKANKLLLSLSLSLSLIDLGTLKAYISFELKENVILNLNESTKPHHDNLESVMSDLGHDLSPPSKDYWNNFMMQASNPIHTSFGVL